MFSYFQKIDANSGAYFDLESIVGRASFKISFKLLKSFCLPILDVAFAVATSALALGQR
jgi:hypothetical protein